MKMLTLRFTVSGDSGIDHLLLSGVEVTQDTFVREIAKSEKSATLVFRGRAKPPMLHAGQPCTLIVVKSRIIAIEIVEEP